MRSRICANLNYYIRTSIQSSQSPSDGLFVINTKPNKIKRASNRGCDKVANTLSWLYAYEQFVREPFHKQDVRVIIMGFAHSSLRTISRRFSFL